MRKRFERKPWDSAHEGSAEGHEEGWVGGDEGGESGEGGWVGGDDGGEGGEGDGAGPTCSRH